MRPKVFVTKPGAILLADGRTNSITCNAGSITLMDRKKAMCKDENRIATFDLEERVFDFVDGGVTNLNGDHGQIRFSASTGLVKVQNGQQQVVLGTNDAKHPTKPLHANVACGHLGDHGSETPREAAWREFCEEFILTNGKKIACWIMEGFPLHDQRALEYSRREDLDRSLSMCEQRLRVYPTKSKIHGSLCFNGVTEHLPVIHSFEIETSNLLFGFTVQSNVPNGWFIVDGEKIPGNKWRDAPVVSGDKIKDYQLTTGARNFLRAFESGLTLV